MSTEITSNAPGQRMPRDAWSFLAVGGASVLGLAVVCVWPGWAGTLGESISATVLIAALAACGLVLVREPQQRGTGVILLAAAALVWVSWSYLLPGPFPYLATAFSWTWLLLLGYVLLRYPAARLAGPDRWIFAVAAADLVLLPLVDATLGEPGWFGFRASTLWLGFGAGGEVHEVLRSAQQAVLAALVLAECLRLTQKLRSATRPQKEAQSAVLIALGAAIAVGGATAVVKAFGVDGPLVDSLDAVANAFLVLVPVAFLWQVIRTRRAELTRAQSVSIPDPGAHDPDSLGTLLTPRERAVLELIASGASNTAIQEKLRATPGSVERAIGNVYSKLGISDSPNVNRRVAAVIHFQRSKG